MKYPLPRVAAIHDLSGFGRCSLTVIIPILSAMGVQVCPVPTAVLSTHTGGYEDFTFVDLTTTMRDYLSHWERLNLSFECIYSGFLGSTKQIEIVKEYILSQKAKNTLAVVDPVFADDGKIYQTFDDQMVTEMSHLVEAADIITPNITEAAFLLGKEYPTSLTISQVKEWLIALSQKGPHTVIMTSVPLEETDRLTSVVAYERQAKRFWKVSCEVLPTQYPGTGDVFTSVLIGALLKGDNLPIAIDRAVHFVSTALRTSYGYQLPEREGVLLEKILPHLNSAYIDSQYEII